MNKRTILFRYIFNETLSPFLLGLLIFTFVLLMNKVLKLMDMVVNKGVGIGDVCSLIVCLFPSFLVLTIPMAVLLGILICLGRLSSDTEIIALKSSGVSLYQMLPPFVVFCLAGFVLTGLFSLYLLPRGNSAFRNRVVQLAKQHTEAHVQEGVFNDFFNNMVIYTRSFDTDSKKINGILISDRRDPSVENLIVAEEGYILFDQTSQNMLLRLFQGSIHKRDKRSRAYEHAVFETYDMKIDLSSLTREKKRTRAREMSITGLLKKIRLRQEGGHSIYKYSLELNRRFAYPFACFVFGLLGVALGAFWRRGGRPYGFIMSIFIVFLYYLFMQIGENILIMQTILVPGPWLPNFVLGALGFYLFIKAAREEDVPLFVAVRRHGAPFVDLGKRLWQRKKGAKTD